MRGPGMSIVHCSHCRGVVDKPKTNCPHCGEVLSLRRERHREPGQIIKDMNKFIVVAIVFFLLLVSFALMFGWG